MLRWWRGLTDAMTRESALVAELLRLGVFLARTGGRLAAEFGLSQQQFVILKAVEERGPVSQKRVRSALLFERSNVSKAVGRLRNLELIEVSRSPDDGRVTLLEITDRGRSVVDACMGVFEEWNRIWSRQLKAQEIDRAVSLLRKLDGE